MIKEPLNLEYDFLSGSNQNKRALGMPHLVNEEKRECNIHEKGKRRELW